MKDSMNEPTSNVGGFELMARDAVDYWWANQTSPDTVETLGNVVVEMAKKLDAMAPVVIVGQPMNANPIRCIKCKTEPIGPSHPVYCDKCQAARPKCPCCGQVIPD